MIRLEDAGLPPLLRPTRFAAAPGESHLILGANGSGKTTLLRLLSGLALPSAGRVLVDGRDVHAPDGAGLHARAKRAGGAEPASLWPRLAVLFEEPDPQLLGDTVEGEIAFGLESLALPPREIRSRTAAALAESGLEPLASRDPRGLSAGEKARVLLAAALAARPSILLLDQSLAHLDPRTRRELESRIAEEARGGRLGIVRTHQEAEAPFPGEHLHVMSSGRLEPAGSLTPSAVLDARGVPLPLALRASAALAAADRWSGHLVSTVSAFRASVGRQEDDGRWRGGKVGPGIPRAVVEGGGRYASRPADPGDGRDQTDPVLALERIGWMPPGTRHPVIQDVDLRVHAGEIVALTGASGTGKTTLLRIAAGLMAPSRGRVARAAPRIERVPPVMLAMEYPERQLFGRTVAEDVAVQLWIEGVPAPERARRAARALESMGLAAGEFLDRVPATLSEGEKRRAAIAALLVEPALILLLDEPTAGLDPDGRRALRTALGHLRETGRAILFASHDLDFVSSVADRVVVLGGGREPAGSIGRGTARVLAEGAPEALWSDDALLDRAGLLPPDATLIARTLRERGWLPSSPVRDGDALIEALATRATAPLTR